MGGMASGEGSVMTRGVSSVLLLLLLHYYYCYCYREGNHNQYISDAGAEEGAEADASTGAADASAGADAEAGAEAGAVELLHTLMVEQGMRFPMHLHLRPSLDVASA